jgi:predicted metal-binding membrane protein
MTALLSRAPARARLVVPVGLIVITAFSWLYLFLLSARMGDMKSPLAMPMTSSWTGTDVLLMWTMWSVMMAGMMLPSAAPMISAYAATVRSERAQLHGSTPFFLAGYLVAWSGFAALATGAQWALHDAALVNAMGVSTSRWLGGLLLVGAGAYQFTGVKDACLSKCRTPLGFLLTSWRSGPGGALMMGVHHGTLCIGCCWALMTLLFVLGVMNLWWIALVAAVVLLEKLVPSDALTRVLGAALVVWGVGLLADVA